MTVTSDRHQLELEEKRIEALARAVLTNAHEPKSKAISKALGELIERGFWRPGDRLPTEKELAEVLKMSLGTVQVAMRELTASGLVERRRGAGSFVSSSRSVGGTIWHFRFHYPESRELLPWEADVRSVEEISEQGPWSAFLADSLSFIRICRTVKVDDALTLWSEVYVDGERFRPLLDLPPDFLSTKNLRVFLHERYNAPTFRAVHRVRSRRIAAEHAALIGCDPGDAGLELKAFCYSYRDSPILFQKIVVPPTELELEILG